MVTGMVPSLRPAEQALEIYRKHPERQSIEHFYGLVMIGTVSSRAAKFDMAEPLLKEALAELQRVDADHPRTLYTPVELAILYRAKREFKKAEDHLKAALEGERKVLGD